MTLDGASYPAGVSVEEEELYTPNDGKVIARKVFRFLLVALGVLAFGYALWGLWSLTWPHAEGTVVACGTTSSQRANRPAGPGGYECTVKWAAGDGEHEKVVPAPKDVKAGDKIDLHVKNDQAAVSRFPWASVFAVCAGLLLFGMAYYKALRRRFSRT